MAKKFILFFFIISCLFLVSCSNSVENTDSLKENKDYISIKTEYFSFEVPSEFSPSEKKNMYYNENTQTAIGIVRTVPLYPDDLNTVLDSLKDLYNSTYTIEYISDSLDEFYTKDNILCYIAEISYSSEDKFFAFERLLILPEHNLILTINIQSIHKDNLNLNLIDDIQNSIVFRDISSNMLANASFADNNGGYLVLETENTFKYYPSKDDTENYLYGEYKSAFNEEALDLLISQPTLENSYQAFKDIQNTQLTGYTILYDDNILSDNYIVCDNDFYSLLLNFKGEVIDNKDNNLDTVSLYYGHFVPSLNGFDFINLANGNGVFFTKIEN